MILELADGTRYKLPDVDYETYVANFPWTGSSDMAYAAYLRSKNMHQVQDFREEALTGARLIVVKDEQELSFALITRVEEPDEMAQAWLKHGQEFPYHDRELGPSADRYERAALGVLADLCDRKSIKHELYMVDAAVREEIVQTMASIIKEAMQ